MSRSNDKQNGQKKDYSNQYISREKIIVQFSISIVMKKAYKKFQKNTTRWESITTTKKEKMERKWKTCLKFYISDLKIFWGNASMEIEIKCKIIMIVLNHKDLQNLMLKNLDG